MTPKDTPHTATQGASESDAFKRWAIENHHAYLTARGLRFIDDDEAALWTGWQGRAALAKRQPAPADPQAPSQEARAWVDVLAERRRQVEAEGWTAEHDDKHSDGQMAYAAMAYIRGPGWPFPGGNDEPPQCWPWSRSWWKPSGERRNLVKAAALILAEIERLDRAAIAKGER